MTGSLYIVSTPIGNLEDITHRAIRILREVDLIACEDTRHTQKLLSHFGIDTPTISYHDHNERERAPELLRKLNEGKNIAIVSDAGTPGISDPGFRIVKQAIEAGVRVVPIPGPTAFVSALVSSGFPTDEFFFAGFLPARSSQRRKRLTELADIPATLVFYEAPHRIGEALKDAYEILGERDAAIARELTKLHEQMSSLAADFSKETRGEIVLIIDKNVISGATKPANDLRELVERFETEGMDSRSALKKAAKELGISRDEAYRRLATERTEKKTRKPRRM
jgi:16S rRNA (cytidine1402-2'-O)-methyltransferase